MGEDAQVVLMGDFNARIGARMQTQPRSSPDDKVCARGTELLRYCAAYDLEVLNGTALHLPSTRNHYTSYQPNGSAVVDYAILSAALVEAQSVESFSVRPHYASRSDHAPLALVLALDWNPTPVVPGSGRRARPWAPPLPASASRADELLHEAVYKHVNPCGLLAQIYGEVSSTSDPVEVRIP
uniref:C-24(28) sterol reductase n=1 Tax=Ganoderma boninense TaxID=34458 RepID=A0A5K1JXA0_9APHY|nr:C-24(28) sterol reductase [Ganoderma boninense]